MQPGLCSIGAACCRPIMQKTNSPTVLVSLWTSASKPTAQGSEWQPALRLPLWCCSGSKPPHLPDKPLVLKGTGLIAHVATAPGWVIPCGGPQHITTQQLLEELAKTRTASCSDGLAAYVSRAEGSAGCLKEAWDTMKVAGEMEPRRDCSV